MSWFPGRVIYFPLLLAVLIGMAFSSPSRAEMLQYKSYVVREDMGREILCDPYIVQRNDYILKIFKERGDISSTDFPEFLSIFKRLNPEVVDINRIQPGQHIFIPLKKIMAENLPNQQTGVITIPFMNISTLGGILPTSTSRYESESYSSRSLPHSGLETAANLLEARLSNLGTYYFPRIGESDLELNLKRFPVLEFPDGNRTLIVPPPTGPSLMTAFSESDIAAITSFWKNLSILTIALNATTEEILEAFFTQCRSQKSDPIISFFDNGVTVSVCARWWLTYSIRRGSVQSETKKIGIIPSVPDTAHYSTGMADYLSKHGIHLKVVTIELLQSENRVEFPVLLPPLIPLSPPRVFVKELLSALAIPYTPDAVIRFPYGGIQISAVSNVISTTDGKCIVVDFGNLYGDTIDAIEKTGLGFIRVMPNDPWQERIPRLLTAAGYRYEANPTMPLLKTSADFGVKVSMPGFLVFREGRPTWLLSPILPDPAVIRLLNAQRIDILGIDAETAENGSFPEHLDRLSNDGHPKQED